MRGVSDCFNVFCCPDLPPTPALPQSVGIIVYPFCAFQAALDYRMRRSKLWSGARLTGVGANTYRNKRNSNSVRGPPIPLRLPALPGYLASFAHFEQFRPIDISHAP